eukprot:5491009-Pleurochrysis_carterae.AAC.1
MRACACHTHTLKKLAPTCTAPCAVYTALYAYYTSAMGRTSHIVLPASKRRAAMSQMSNGSFPLHPERVVVFVPTAVASSEFGALSGARCNLAS